MEETTVDEVNNSEQTVPSDKKPAKSQNLSEVMEVLTAVRRLESRGLTRAQVVALIADEVTADWCGSKQTWKIRKARVAEILNAVDRVGREVGR
jgi:hypothetical protein